MIIPENIIIGTVIDGLTLLDLNILPTEQTVHMTAQEAKELNNFLPRILVSVGLFNTTSEIKRLNVDRMKSNKIVDMNEKNLWRYIDQPEFTYFKVGKKIWWLVVGQL